MKTLVVYYSNKGSNKYLAEKIAKTLSCEIEQIRPRLNLFLLFLMNIHLGNRALKHKINNYERIILCGPIWMGKFIPPLRNFVLKNKEAINKLVFVTCCGSSYEKKDEKFGHSYVFNEIENLLGEKCLHCQAFPIGLVMPEGQEEDSDAFMKTHLNDDNFKGKIQEVFDNLINKLSEENHSVLTPSSS